ncbi:MAG: transglutaminase-like domain-containing protein [Lachnospiraceae bacterium]|nr:transglutaminase-like domain-containing protein [Lachnospiraceae bacterium]
MQSKGVYGRKTSYGLSRAMLPLLLAVFLFTGCASSSQGGELPEVQTPANSQKGSRDNSTTVLVPAAPGIEFYENEVAHIDCSNTAEGYIMAWYDGTCQKVKFQVTGPDGVTYTYNLTSACEAFPLSGGDGTYNLAIYENISGNQYSTCLTTSTVVQITNEFGPTLYPNQYVDFTPDSQVIEKAKELSYSANSDLDVVRNIYNYMIQNVTYDFEKADTVQSGYLCNVDTTLQTGTGICLDYAALMTSMLRVEGIPTRMEVGYAGTAYHAWISTYIKDVGWVNGVIQFDGTSWQLMDPTFGASTGEEDLKKYIGEGDNYVTKYIY